MRYSSILFLLVILSLSACKPRDTVDSTSKRAKSQMTNDTAPTPSPVAPLVYDSFDDIEYIFNYDNDTTYVINFWATWCRPCVRELPYFDKLHDEYKDKKMRIILVSLDFPKQIETKLVPFMQKNKLKPEVMVLTDGDANAWVGKVDNAWDGAIPVTLIYNKDERDFVYGDVFNYKELKSRVVPLIK